MKEKKRYADVIVDISHEKIDRPFQYLIPSALEEAVHEGTRVRIPFGMGNRLITGYVIEIKSVPDFDPGKIKEIDSICEEGITIEGSLIRLAAWMKETYGSTMIRCLKTILPVKEKEKIRIREQVVLNRTRSEALQILDDYRKKHYKAKARLMELLAEKGTADRLTVMKELKIPASTLKSMQNEGVLRIEAHRSWRMPAELEEAAGQKKIPVPTAAQSQVIDGILEEWRTKNRTCLIHGITGSGKTLIYMELTKKVLSEGRQAIILIPEIALSWQIVQRFLSGFGDIVTVLHSRMGRSERFDQFERVRSGEAKIIVGPRSALFAPFENLGLIVIDEEQELSYRSEESPRYDAREAAVFRGKLEGAHVVMGSATPSIDSYQKCMEGEYALFDLPDRIGEARLPRVFIADMRKELQEGNRSMLSRLLEEKIAQRLEKKEQIMLFLNRRGYAGFFSCRSCGYVVRCPHCDVSMTLHSNGKMICHYCGYETPEVKQCPSCGSEFISGLSIGTQKVADMVQRKFPQARILRMDQDSTRKKGGHEKILRAFMEHEADILVGTQMIVKGHDFPNVTLVGALMADMSLFASDYRAPEKTYQLLVQAIGRAGRGELGGEAVIQTYQPEHYSIQAAASQDYAEFFNEEMEERKAMLFPPAAHLLAVRGSCKDEERLHKAMFFSGKFLQMVGKKKTTTIIGPAPEVVSKVQDQFREVLFIKEEDEKELRRLRQALEKYIEINQGFDEVSIQYDLDV